MTIRFAASAAVVSALLLSATALAAPPTADEKAFVGAWEGEMIIHFGDDAKREKVRMEFGADGLVAVQSGEKDKREENRWRYDAAERRVIFMGKDADKKEQIYLTNIQVTKDSLSGDMVPATKEPMPKGFSLKLELKRAGAATPIEKPDEPALIQPSGTLDKKALVGKWQGTMTLVMGGAPQVEKVSMEFLPTGLVEIKTREDREKAKTEQVPYEVDLEKRRVAFRKPKTGEVEVYLESIAIDTKTLKGHMVPAEDKPLPKGMRIVLELSR